MKLFSFPRTYWGFTLTVILLIQGPLTLAGPFSWGRKSPVENNRPTPPLTPTQDKMALTVLKALDGRLFGDNSQEKLTVFEAHQRLRSNQTVLIALNFGKLANGRYPDVGHVFPSYEYKNKNIIVQEAARRHTIPALRGVTSLRQVLSVNALDRLTKVNSQSILSPKELWTGLVLFNHRGSYNGSFTLIWDQDESWNNPPFFIRLHTPDGTTSSGLYVSPEPIERNRLSIAGATFRLLEEQRPVSVLKNGKCEGTLCNWEDLVSFASIHHPKWVKKNPPPP